MYLRDNTFNFYHLTFNLVFMIQSSDKQIRKSNILIT